MENYYFSILFNDISKYNVLISLLPIYDLLKFFGSTLLLGAIRCHWICP